MGEKRKNKSRRLTGAADTRPHNRQPVAASRDTGKFCPDEAAQKNMLTVARKTASIGAVAEAAGVSYTTLENYCSRNLIFAAKFRDAINTAIDAAEAELYRRAMTPDTNFYDKEGNVVEVYDACGNRLHPLSAASNDLLKYFLRHRKPKVYNPATVVAGVSLDVKTLSVDRVKNMSVDELAQLLLLPDSVLPPIDLEP